MFDTKQLKLLAITTAAILVMQIIIIVSTDPILVYGDHTISWSKLWFFASLAYLAFSVRWWDQQVYDEASKSFKTEKGFIDADEMGVLKFFGRPFLQIDSGPPFAPLGLVTVVKLTAVTQQHEFPDEPQNIFRNEDETMVPEGKKPPTRINFRNKISEADARKIFGDEYTIDGISFNPIASDDGLSKRVTAEVVPVVRWAINDGITFLRKVGSISYAKQQMEDELVRVLSHLLTNMSVSQALLNHRWISRHLLKAVQNHTHEWGVKLDGAFLKIINLNHSLNTAVVQAAQAEFQGRAEREMIEQIGAGNAKAARDLEEATLLGRTEGLVALAKGLGIRGDAAIAQFVAGQVGSGDGTIILGESGITQLAGIAAAFSQNKGNGQIITGAK